MLLRDPREISNRLVAEVFDLCQRAGRPSSEGEIRLALARLGSRHDEELRALCRRPPAVTPLSPHALVDIVLGMPPEQAAALEEAGAYLALAREAAEQALEMQERAAQSAPPAPKPKASAPRKRREKAGPPAPILRRRAEVEARKEAAATREEEEEVAPPPPRPGRRPAAPTFGRFVEGKRAKRPFSELEGPEGKAILQELVVELRGNPPGLAARLGMSWSAPSGRFDEEVIDRLLRLHGLEAMRAKEERDNLRGLLRRHRGFARPIARLLDLPPAELRERIDAYGLADEARELRIRAKEEALAETSLRGRLQLVLRHEDRLREMRILGPIEGAARQELRDRIVEAEAPERIETPEALLEWVRRDLDLDRGSWRKAVERFGLLGAACRRLGLPPPRPPREEFPRWDRGFPGRGRPPGPGGDQRFGFHDRGRPVGPRDHGHPAGPRDRGRPVGPRDRGHPTGPRRAPRGHGPFERGPRGPRGPRRDKP